MRLLWKEGEERKYCKGEKWLRHGSLRKVDNKLTLRPAKGPGTAASVPAAPKKRAAVSKLVFIPSVVSIGFIIDNLL